MALADSLVISIQAKTDDAINGIQKVSGQLKLTGEYIAAIADDLVIALPLGTIQLSGTLLSYAG
jgi:hypothetical protein